MANIHAELAYDDHAGNVGAAPEKYLPRWMKSKDHVGIDRERTIVGPKAIGFEEEHVQSV
jgi:hypothetical protein